MPGPFDPTFGAPQNNFGGGPVPQQPQSFAPELQGTPGDISAFMDDPQFQIEFQKAIDSVPGLAEQMQSDPELQSHIINTIAQGPGAHQGGPIMPQSAQQPQAPPPPPDAPPSASTAAPPRKGWAGVGDYMQSQDGKDDMMLGLIMSNYGTDPQKALEMAIRFKQVKDQRVYQAKQNDLQREATAANVKMKADADKAEKVDKDWMTNRAKGIAQLQQAGLTENDITAKLGPWSKENDQESMSMVTSLLAKKKSDDAREKEEQVDFKNMQGIARDTFSSGSVLSSKYTQPTLKDGKPNPKYDADFAKGLETLASTRKEIREVHMANQKAHQKLMERRYKLEAGKMSDEQKARMKLKFDMLEDIYKRVMEAKKQMDTYKPYSEGENIFGEAYHAFVSDYNEAMEEYKAKASEIQGVAAPAMSEVTTPGGEEVAAPPPMLTPQAAGAPPPQQDAAMAQRIRGLQKLVNEAQQAGKDPKEIIDRFKAKFPGVLAE